MASGEGSLWRRLGFPLRRRRARPPLEVGYISEALNQEQGLDTETLPVSDGPASKGYLFTKDIWQAFLAGPRNGLNWCAAAS